MAQRGKPYAQIRLGSIPASGQGGSWKFVFGPLLVMLLFATIGCSTVRSLKRHASFDKDSYEKVTITYRTDTDRLNVASTAQFGVQPASLQSGSSSWLPSCCIGTVVIRYPHPGGQPGSALVTVALHPTGDADGTVSRSVWTKIRGLYTAESKDDSAHIKPVEVWTMELPKWQLDNILAGLHRSQFFRKSVSVLNPNVFLAVHKDDIAVGKNCKSIPELDSMVLRIRSQGRRVSAPDAAAPGGWVGPIANRSNNGISRLPALPLAPR